MEEGRRALIGGDETDNPEGFWLRGKIQCGKVGGGMGLLPSAQYSRKGRKMMKAP